MNIQEWRPDTCNCVVYTHTDGNQYYDVKLNPENIKFTKPVKEIHCIHHTQKGQAFVDENHLTNKTIYEKYFQAGEVLDLENPDHKLKLKNMALEKAELKRNSTIIQD